MLSVDHFLVIYGILPNKEESREEVKKNLQVYQVGAKRVYVGVSPISQPYSCTLITFEVLFEV